MLQPSELVFGKHIFFVENAVSILTDFCRYKRPLSILTFSRPHNSMGSLEIKTFFKGERERRRERKWHALSPFLGDN